MTTRCFDSWPWAATTFKNRGTCARVMRTSWAPCPLSAPSSRAPTIFGKYWRSFARNIAVIRLTNLEPLPTSSECCAADCAILAKGPRFMMGAGPCMARRAAEFPQRAIKPFEIGFKKQGEVMTNLDLVTSHASRILHVVQNGLQPAEIEPHVTRSWYRCLREYRIEPSAPRQNDVLNSQFLKELQQRMGALLPVARAEMESLYEQIAGSGFAVILSDTQGVVLTTITDPALQREFRQAGLSLGALWDERP